MVRSLYCCQVTKDVNNMTVKMPNQCFINGRFEDAESGKTYDTINPMDGSVSVCVCVCGFDLCVCEFDLCAIAQVICKVSYASVGDVDRAVAAAKEAYDNGPWGRMNPRDRGSLLYRYVAPPGGHQRDS